MLLHLLMLIIIGVLYLMIIVSTLSTPFVTLAGIISSELKRRQIKQRIDTSIQHCLTHDKHTVTIDIPENWIAYSNIIADQLINQLNQNAKITKLKINNSYRGYHKIDTIDPLILKLKYITHIEAPSHADSLSTSFFDYTTLAFLPQSNLKKLEAPRLIQLSGLFKFFNENNKLDELNVHQVRDQKNEADSIKGFNEMINESGIHYPCKLLTVLDKNNNMLKQIELTMDHILEANTLLKSYFEFYKIMVDHSNTNLVRLNNDLLKYITMSVVQVCPILHQNQKGFIRAIQSPGFFSQQLRLKDFDSQDEMQSNHMKNEI